MNTELVSMLLKLVGKASVIMIFIVLACLVTPKIARRLEKKYPQRFDPPDEEEQQKPEDYQVTGAFEASKEEDWDPNYKIYNTDIYGVDFKHGKKQKHKKG